MSLINLIQKHMKILEESIMVKELIIPLVTYLIKFYLKTKYKPTTIDLSIHQLFGADPDPVQLIDFSKNLKWEIEKQIFSIGGAIIFAVSSLY